MIVRRAVTGFTLVCFIATQTASLAGPHEEGVAAGQAANPLARGNVTAPDASSVVPGYTSSPAQRSYYRQPNLAAQANARLASCATLPDDPTCQALRGAVDSANTPRPAVSADDPAVAAARDIARTPSSVLGSLAAYYSGCNTSTSSRPAGTQVRSCLRHVGVGNYSCARSLSVGVERSTSCTPGDWFAHASAGRLGLDAQCLPDQPEAAQRFRVTQDGNALAFFDVDMSTPAVFPAKVAVIGTSAGTVGLATGAAVWIADKACIGSNCSLSAMIASESQFNCTGDIDSGYTCTSIEPFLKVYAACRAATQSGDNIQDTVCDLDNGCTTSVLDGSKCFAPVSAGNGYPGIDITGAVPGSYWNVDAERAVVGWSANPAYGPIPTMRLGYTRATSAVTTTDRWDEQCPALAAGGRCTVSGAATCTEGPATKLIDGVAVTRDCWRYTSTMSCGAGAAADQCAPLAAAGCTPQASVCTRSNAVTGSLRSLRRPLQLPDARQRPSTIAGNCPSNVFCLERQLLRHPRTEGCRLRAQHVDARSGARGRRLSRHRPHAGVQGRREPLPRPAAEELLLRRWRRCGHEQPEHLRQRLAAGLRRADECREPRVPRTRACRRC